MANRAAKVKDYRIHIQSTTQWLKEWHQAEQNQTLLVVEVFSSYFGKTEVMIPEKQNIMMSLPGDAEKQVTWLLVNIAKLEQDEKAKLTDEAKKNRMHRATAGGHTPALREKKLQDKKGGAASPAAQTQPAADNMSLTLQPEEEVDVELVNVPFLEKWTGYDHPRPLWLFFKDGRLLYEMNTPNPPKLEMLVNAGVSGKVLTPAELASFDLEPKIKTKKRAVPTPLTRSHTKRMDTHMSSAAKGTRLLIAAKLSHVPDSISGIPAPGGPLLAVVGKNGATGKFDRHLFNYERQSDVTHPQFLTQFKVPRARLEALGDELRFALFNAPNDFSNPLEVQSRAVLLASVTINTAAALGSAEFALGKKTSVTGTLTNEDGSPTEMQLTITIREAVDVGEVTRYALLFKYPTLAEENTSRVFVGVLAEDGNAPRPLCVGFTEPQDWKDKSGRDCTFEHPVIVSRVSKQERQFTFGVYEKDAARSVSTQPDRGQLAATAPQTITALLALVQKARDEPPPAPVAAPPTPVPSSPSHRSASPSSQPPPIERSMSLVPSNGAAAGAGAGANEGSNTPRDAAHRYLGHDVDGPHAWATLPLLTVAAPVVDGGASPPAITPASIQFTIFPIPNVQPVKAAQTGPDPASLRVLLNLSVQGLKHAEGEGREPLLALFAKNPTTGVYETVTPAAQTDRTSAADKEIIVFTKQILLPLPFVPENGVATVPSEYKAILFDALETDDISTSKHIGEAIIDLRNLKVDEPLAITMRDLDELDLPTQLLVAYKPVGTLSPVTFTIGCGPLPDGENTGVGGPVTVRFFERLADSDLNAFLDETEPAREESDKTVPAFATKVSIDSYSDADRQLQVVVLRGDVFLGEVSLALSELTTGISGDQRQFELTKDFLPVLTNAGKPSYLRLTPSFSLSSHGQAACVPFPELVPDTDQSDKLVMSVRATNLDIADWTGWSGNRMPCVGLFKQVGNDFTYIGRTEKHVSRSHEPRSLIYSQLFVIDAPSVTAAPAVSDVPSSSSSSSSEETKTDANSEDSGESAAAATASSSSSSSSSSSTPDAVFRFVVMPIGNEPAEQPLDLSYPLHLGAATVNVTPLLANAEEGTVIQQSIPLQSASNSPAGLVGEAALDVCLASVGKINNIVLYVDVRGVPTCRFPKFHPLVVLKETSTFSKPERPVLFRIGETEALTDFDGAGKGTTAEFELPILLGIYERVDREIRVALHAVNPEDISDKQVLGYAVVKASMLQSAEHDAVELALQLPSQPYEVPPRVILWAGTRKKGSNKVFTVEAAAAAASASASAPLTSTSGESASSGAVSTSDNTAAVDPSRPLTNAEKVAQILALKSEYRNNIALQSFDQAYYDSLPEEQQTRLLKCLDAARINRDSVMGCFANSATDYDTLHPFFIKALSAYQKVDLSGKQFRSNWDVTTAPGAPASGILDVSELTASPVLPVRLRASRNIAKFPLPAAMSQEDRVALEEEMGALFDALIANPDFGGEYVSITPGHKGFIDGAQYAELVEAGLMFRDTSVDPLLNASGISGQWPYGRGCYMSKDREVVIWVGEEDHLRIACVQNASGFNQALDRLKAAVEAVEAQLGDGIARHADLGVLTSCPTRIGTGLYAAVQFPLPKLCADGSITRAQQVATSLGLTVRGPVGKDGSVEVSPRATVGSSEAESVTALYLGLFKLKKADDEYTPEQATAPAAAPSLDRQSSSAIAQQPAASLDRQSSVAAASSSSSSSSSQPADSSAAPVTATETSSSLSSSASKPSLERTSSVAAASSSSSSASQESSATPAPAPASSSQAADAAAPALDRASSVAAAPINPDVAGPLDATLAENTGLEAPVAGSAGSADPPADTAVAPPQPDLATQPSQP